MDDDHLDDSTRPFDFGPARSRPGDPGADGDLGADIADAGSGDPWSELGARRGPRQPAEGVRIIGADEAAAAIESGQVAAKLPDDELRFGDVPPQPSGPRPSLRFPGDDPSQVAKPPVAGEPLPVRDERESAVVEAARRWDEALARSSAGRPRTRGADADDLFGYGRSSVRMDAGTSGSSIGGSNLGERAGGSSFGRSSVGTASAAGAGGGEPPPPPPPPPPSRDASGGSYRTPSWLDEGDDDLFGAAAPSAPPAPPPPPAPFEPASMQHWTEPPSGEVPRILVDDDEEAQSGDEDLSAWGSLGARPRWRDQPTDWEDADFDDAILADEGHRVGALRARQDDSAPFSFDEPEPEPPPPPPSPPRAGARPPAGGGRARVSSRPTGGPPLLPGGNSRGGSMDSRDLSTRVVTGAIAAGVFLLACAIGPAAVVFLVAAALTVAAAELFQGLRTRGYHPATLLGLVGTPSLVGAVYWRNLDAYPLVLALFVVFTLLWYLTGVVRARPAMNVAVTLMAFLYVSFLGSFAALILAGGRLGVRILIGAILATVAYDIGAYFVGRSMGKTPLAPAISPNKTVEGLVGASFVTLLVCLVLVRAIHPWDGGKAFWLAVVVSVAAPLGDLCESMIKRDLDVKDIGTLLPGHGGVLDRIDALLFVIPATYYLVRLVF